MVNNHFKKVSVAENFQFLLCVDINKLNFLPDCIQARKDNLFSKIILKGSSTHVISDSFHKEKMSTFKIKRVMTFCSVDKKVIFFFRDS